MQQLGVTCQRPRRTALSIYAFSLALHTDRPPTIDCLYKDILRLRYVMLQSTQLLGLHASLGTE